MPAGQAQTVAMPKRWPLMAPLQSRSSFVTPYGLLPGASALKDAKLINGYAELDPATKEYIIWKRPGVAASPQNTSSYPNGCGCYTDPASGYVFWVTMSGLGGGNVGYLYCNASGTPSVPIATLTMPGNTPTQVWFQSINSSPPTVIVGTGQAAYIITLTTLVVTQVTDTSFPTQTVPGWVYLDATLYTMDYKGNIWNAADLNNGAVWTPASEIQASNTADLGVGLFKQLTYIIAFKQSVTQIFYDAGNATGSPLSVVPDAQLPLGCLNANSVVSLDSTLLWIAGTVSGQPQVARLDNLTPNIISTPAIERILQPLVFSGGGATPGGSYYPTSGVWAFPLKIGGHRFYVLNLTQNNFTLVYDVDQDLWYYWTDASGNYWPFVSSTYTAASSGGQLEKKLVQHIFNGGLYQVDGNWNITGDLGSAITLDLYTVSEDFGTVRNKNLSMLYFRGDKVPGSKLYVRHSSDDYNTWSNFREVDLSLNKPRLWNNGAFHRRAYHLRHTANTTFRLKSMDLEMDLGTE